MAAQTIGKRTEGLEPMQGFLSLHWDEAAGRLLLELSRLGEEMLYLRSLATGIGSVDVGLDRGTIAGSALVEFHRVGPKVLLVQKNLGFRSTAEDLHLARSVEESFAESVLASFPVEAEEDGRVLIDATKFFLRDATGVAQALKNASLGDFKLDEERSALYPAHTKAFPQNTELEALLTFAGENVSSRLRPLLPDGRSLSVRQHHSFVALPEPGFRARVLDPRVGFGSLSFKDYGAAFDEPMEKHWVRRWRLEKKDPAAAVSEPVKPIVYYLDRGIPEPVRSAMREGALWWNEAFEAAGFRNAFQVLDLPEDADPMDVRYSVIQWVHRAERGWSIGATFSDPRTGEIICGKPRMDSHRVRTVHSYWSAAVPPVTDEACEAGIDPSGLLALNLGAIEDEESLMLQRQALLTAHEVGHTLGLPHNFSASLYDRGSVMEYVTPRIAFGPDGKVDFSQAYRHGLGAWDIHAIRWAYAPFSEDEEEAALAGLVEEGLRDGILFLPTSDPRWNPYDDGADPVSYLRDAFEQRQKLLWEVFGPQLLKKGEAVANLDQRLSYVYFFHRFAIESAVKYVGGMEHTNAFVGDGQTPTAIIEPERQREALTLLLDCLEPTALDIPEEVLVNLPPPPFGSSPGYDAAKTRAGYAFDQLAAARALTGMIVESLLEGERLARVAAFAARYEEALTVREVLDAIIDRAWAGGDAPPREAALARVAQRAVIDRVLTLSAADDTSAEVKTALHAALMSLQAYLEFEPGMNEDESEHRAKARHDIVHFLERPKEWAPKTTPPSPPPGAPV
jgi:hypothetical protein